MDIESCYQLGYVIRKHGLKGEVFILLDVDDPGYYQKMESVFIAISGDDMLVPFFIERIQISADKALVKFEGVNTAEAADELISCNLYLPLEFLPPLNEDQFYYHEIVGYSVFDETSGNIGQVEQVYSFVSQDLLSVAYQGKEILIPINDQIIRKVDKNNKSISVDLPAGLLDIYLTQNGDKK